MTYYEITASEPDPVTGILEVIRVDTVAAVLDYLEDLALEYGVDWFDIDGQSAYGYTGELSTYLARVVLCA